MKLNYKRTILVGFAFMAISAFWQMYDTIIPLILKYTFNLKETISGVVMGADNLLAVFLLPAFGVMSDRCQSKLGRRRPYIFIGTILSVIFMMLLTFFDHPDKLALFMIVLFFLLLSMSLYRSPAVALMPDLTPTPLLSQGNAVINLMGAVGYIVTLVLIKFLGGEPQNRPSYVPLFAAIAGLMILSIIVLAIFIDERKLVAKVKDECDAAGVTIGDPEQSGNKDGRPMAAIRSLAPNVRKSFLMILFSVAFWYFAYNAVTSAFSRYAIEVWKMDSNYADCLLVASVVAVASYLPIGIISGKLGRKKVILIGVVAMFISYVCLFFYANYHVSAVIFFAIIGFGWAAINVNSLPMVVSMCDAGDIGQFTGIYYTFSMSAQVLTPILSGALLQYVSYRTLFVYSAFFMVCAFITMCFVHHGDSKPTAKKNLLEHFDVEE